MIRGGGGKTQAGRIQNGRTHADRIFFLIFFRVFVYLVPLLPLRGQHMVLCHPRWQPTYGLTEFGVCYGGPDSNPGLKDIGRDSMQETQLGKIQARVQ